MTESETLIAQQHCMNLIAALVHAQDHGDAQAAAALFVEDGTWVRSGVPCVGREAILASFKPGNTAIIRHIVSSQMIKVTSPSQATAVSYYLVYAYRNASPATAAVSPLELPVTLGEWNDSFVLTEDGWRFSRREGKRIFDR